MANKPTIIISSGCEKSSKELAGRIGGSLRAIGLTCIVDGELEVCDGLSVLIRFRQKVLARRGKGCLFLSATDALEITLVGTTKKIFDTLYGIAPIFVADKCYLPTTETQPDELVDCTGTVARGRFPDSEYLRALTRKKLCQTQLSLL